MPSGDTASFAGFRLLMQTLIFTVGVVVPILLIRRKSHWAAPNTWVDLPAAAVLGTSLVLCWMFASYR